MAFILMIFPLSTKQLIYKNHESVCFNLGIGSWAIFVPL